MAFFTNPMQMNRPMQRPMQPMAPMQNRAMPSPSAAPVSPPINQPANSTSGQMAYPYMPQGGQMASQSQQMASPYMPQGGQMGGAGFAKGGAVQNSNQSSIDPLQGAVQQNPKVMQLAGSVKQQIGQDIPPEVLKEFIGMLKMALAHPDKYPQIRAAAIADHMVDPEDMPEQFNPKALSLLLTTMMAMLAQSNGQDGQESSDQPHFAQGGLARAAQRLQHHGRFGDTMLAHINPQEAAILKANGGSGTINPATGLPEYSWLSKAFKSIGNAIGIHNWTDVRDAAESAAVLVGNYYLPGSSLLTSHLTSNASQKQLNSGIGLGLQAATGIAGAATGKLNNYKTLAGKVGLGGSAAAMPAAAPPASPLASASGANQAASAAADLSAPSPTGSSPFSTPAVSPSTLAVNNASVIAANNAGGFNGGQSLMSKGWDALKGFGEEQFGKVMQNPLGTAALAASVIGATQKPPQGVPPEAMQKLTPEQQEYFNRPTIKWNYDKLNQDAASAGMDLGSYMAEHWNDIRDGKYNYATGGVADAGGGALSRVAYLARGSGSGRADTINAKLSDGEFVVDAETVALLGDGSTDEGARRLNTMREQLRKQKGAALAKGKFSPSAKSPLAYMQGVK